jgi:hypothetical protein
MNRHDGEARYEAANQLGARPEGRFFRTEERARATLKRTQGERAPRQESVRSRTDQVAEQLPAHAVESR